jgi:hypothetical protein
LIDWCLTSSLKYAALRSKIKAVSLGLMTMCPSGASCLSVGYIS